MRRLLLVALLAAMPGLARAGDAEDKTDLPTAVRLSLAGTTARIQATFAFEVEGPGVAFNTHSVAIPPRSIVTSGAVTVAGKRHALRLESSETVDRAFDALTLKPGGPERAWAFVVDGAGEQITIDTLAARNAKAVLELALDAPTCFVKDVRYVQLPPAWAQRVATANQLVIATANDVGEQCGGATDDDTRWIGFASRELMKQPAGARRIGAIAGRLALDTTHFARVEIDVARQLTEIPADLHTVIVVDHSRSMTTEELEAQRAIVAAYLRGAPSSRVQVVAYTRTAQPLLPSWMNAMHAAPQIDRAIRALPPRNGSNVDAALTEAASWLARARGTKRIVLFSDERLAERFDAAPEELRALVPAGTLVHVVHPDGIGTGLERIRDEDGVLPLLAKHTEGIATFGAVGGDAELDATLLLRPTSLDALAISSVGWQRMDGFTDVPDCGDRIVEGQSCTWWGEGSGAAGPITISGLLWNKPFRRVVHADPSQARAIARVLSALQALSPELQQQVDRAALAVNAVWSLFAQWGGSGGYEDVGGLGRFGSGRFTSSSHDVGIGTPSHGRGTLPLDLHDALKTAVAGCTPGAAKIMLVVETTLEEIVDVGVEVVPGNPTVEACLREAVWDTTLQIPAAPQHVTTHVAFGNKR